MASYTAQTGDVFAAGTPQQGAVTELLTRVNGVIAGCGEAALAVLLGWTQGRIYSASDVTGIVTDAINEHGAGTGGTSTPGELAATAKDYNASLQSIDWRAALDNLAGKTPILLGVSNASALGGSDRGVQGHYISVVGRTAQGAYIVSDPNTPESKSGRYVTYTRAQLNAAQPYSAQVLSSSSGTGATKICIPGTQICWTIPTLPKVVSGAAGGIAGSGDAGGQAIGQGIAAGLFAGLGINRAAQTTLGTALGTASKWISSPTRIVKLIMGMVLITAAVALVVVPKSIQLVSGATGAVQHTQRTFKDVNDVLTGKPPPPAPRKIVIRGPKGQKQVVNIPAQEVAPAPAQPAPAPAQPAPAPAQPASASASAGNTAANVARINELGEQIGRQGVRQARQAGSHMARKQAP
jgi:hypothetical protein